MKYTLLLVFATSIVMSALSFNSFKYKRTISLSEISNFSQDKNDTLYKPNYPSGIYKTKQEFVNKSPSKFDDVEIRKSKIDTTQQINHNCYFYYKSSNKKIKNVFAISYKGHLYFQLKAILKNRNKKDRAQTTYIPNSFVRAIIGGDNFLYTEAELENQWAKQSLSQLGIAGRMAASNLIKGKGIVWDFENKEFNIFKSCKDYNTFIKELLPGDVQECIYHQPNMFKVRETVNKIK